MVGYLTSQAIFFFLGGVVGNVPKRLLFGVSVFVGVWKGGVVENRCVLFFCFVLGS